MGKLLYHIFTFFFHAGIRLASLWNPKAKLWVAGRKNFPSIKPSQKDNVWIHCASVGEFEQGRPLMESIRRQHPHCNIILTFFSPSGYEVRKDYDGADYVFYLPMESRENARRFIAAIQPKLVLWVKYEFWYYYLTELKRQDIPVLMVAGLFREGQPFFKWYGSIWREMLRSFHHFFLQNEKSIELLKTVGISTNTSLGGDTRFDRVIEIAEQFEHIPLIQQFCGSSKVIVLGSTWESDEAEWTHYVKIHPEIKFIFAPHEIDPVTISDLQKEFPGAILFSALKQSGADADAHVLIIDNFGMLSRLYHYAHITYVGGGFNASGIHNVLEAAVHGKPVIHGPEYEKFAEVVDLVETGAGICIENALELEKVLDELWSNEQLLQTKSETARRYVYSKAGATKKIMDYIQENRLLTN